MPTYQTTPQFSHGRPDRTGILLVNLGTPEAPTASAVRQFLKQFLWDRRVVETPRLIWWLILNLVILRFRPARSAKAYQKIWTDRGSPLMLHSVAIGEALQARLPAAAGDPVIVEVAMSYGAPSIGSAIDKLLANGAERILTLPMYPQYSGTTTASVIDAVARKFSTLRWVPEARFISSYHDAPGYIDALASSVRRYWASHGRGDKLLMSFHGVPRSTLLKGDPYHCQCQKTARLLAESLALNDNDWMLTFQSRVGREEWLTPYTDNTLLELARGNLARVDVVCPGFSVDCLETLEEIAIQNAALFRDNGGGELQYIPALNASEEHVSFLEKLLLRHAAGWEQRRPASVGAATRERALALGAAL